MTGERPGSARQEAERLVAAALAAAQLAARRLGEGGQGTGGAPSWSPDGLIASLAAAHAVSHETPTGKRRTH